MFIVGLFSVLDAIMDLPMDALLDHLSLSASVKFALLDRAGEAGRLLQQVLWYEQGEWDALIAARADRQELVQAYLEAVQWADANMHTLYD
jgi:EAL and modified HD-GYP domain-containing signal transduction protein